MSTYDRDKVRKLEKEIEDSGDNRFVGYRPFSKQFDATLREVAIAVAKQFPRLCAPAFWEEVRGRFYPRPDEYDMRRLVLRLVSDGDLVFTGDCKIELPANTSESV